MNMTVKLVLIVGALGITNLVAALPIALIFGQVPPEFVQRIEDFQTLIGASQATIVAAATVVTIYLVARMQMLEDRRKTKSADKREEYAGASVLYAANNRFIAQLGKQLPNVENLEPPREFIDRTVLGTQTEQVAGAVARIMGSYSELQSKLTSEVSQQDLEDLERTLGELRFYLFGLYFALDHITGANKMANAAGLEKKARFLLLGGFKFADVDYE